MHPHDFMPLTREDHHMVDDEIKEQLISELPAVYRTFIEDRNRINNLALDAYLQVIADGGSREDAEHQYFQVFNHHKIKTP